MMVKTGGLLDPDIMPTRRTNLESLDTTIITRNLDIYYEDLGDVYWTLARRKLDNPYLLLSIQAFEKALYHNPKSIGALYKLAFGYAEYKDCTRAKYYLARYRKAIRKKAWHPEHEQLLIEQCSQ